jgi:hypothetical protein
MAPNTTSLMRLFAEGDAAAWSLVVDSAVAVLQLQPPRDSKGDVGGDQDGVCDPGRGVAAERVVTYGSTLKLSIIPLSWCSAMWQCAIHRPGLVTSSSRSTT